LAGRIWTGFQIAKLVDFFSRKPGLYKLILTFISRVPGLAVALQNLFQSYRRSAKLPTSTFTLTYEAKLLQDQILKQANCENRP
jgi:hypothetical protein